MKKRTFQAHQNGEKYYLLLLLSEKLYTQTSQLGMKANYVVHFHTAPAKKSRKITAYFSFRTCTALYIKI